MIPRRQFLFTTAAAITSMILPPFSISNATTISFDQFSPYLIPDASLDFKFDGDNEDFPHEVLWNKDGYLARFPMATQLADTDVLIIGGGMAGLVSVYYLKSKKITLLEQAPQLGGNSKGYKVQNQKKSIGAAYVTIPEEGSEIDLLFKDLELSDAGQIENTSPVFFKTAHYEDFKKTLTQEELTYWTELQTRFVDIYENQYPEIPFSTDTAQTELTLKWDQISFLEWLQQEFTNPVPEKIKEFFQMYSWSSFNASIDEVSGAQFLNFITAETAGVWAFAGGNAEICERLYKKIHSQVDIQCSAFVADVQKTANGYLATYIKDKQLFKIQTKFIIFAAPKFLFDKVFSDDFNQLKKATEKIEFRSYLVANVDFDGAVELPGYDQFMLSGQCPDAPAALKPPKLGFADIVNSNWAVDKNTSTSSITIYRPLPYTGARQFLFNPIAFEKNKNIILNELSERGFDLTKIKKTTITRWGHAMPIASKNLLASNVLSPMYPKAGESLYFAGQDVFANPAFEAAFETAFQSANFINEQI